MVVFKNHLNLVNMFENSIFYLVQDDCMYIYVYIHIIVEDHMKSYNHSFMYNQKIMVDYDDILL